MFFWQGIVLIFNRNGHRKEVAFKFFPKYRQFIPLFFLRCDKKAIRINEIAMKQTVFEAKTRTVTYDDGEIGKHIDRNRSKNYNYISETADYRWFGKGKIVWFAGQLIF